MDGFRIVQSDGNTVGSGCNFLTGCAGRRNVIASNGRSGVRIENALGDQDAADEYARRLARDFPDSPQARQLLRDGL